MLQLEVILSDTFDEETNEFVTTKTTLELEHSLVSLSKWESKYEKPFLTAERKLADEVVDYITMMDLGKNTPPEVFDNLTSLDLDKINDYINAKQTATWFTKSGPQKRNLQVVTSELIYYWITSYEIPWVVETWHLNRLFTLIEVFNEERKASNPNSTKNVNRKGAESLAEERRRINAERKAQMQTSG